MEIPPAMAMICVRGSAGDNLARFSHDDGEEATCRALVLFVLFDSRAVTGLRPKKVLTHCS